VRLHISTNALKSVDRLDAFLLKAKRAPVKNAR